MSLFFYLVVCYQSVPIAMVTGDICWMMLCIRVLRISTVVCKLRSSSLKSMLSRYLLMLCSFSSMSFMEMAPVLTNPEACTRRSNVPDTNCKGEDRN